MPTAADHRAKAEEFLGRAAQALSHSQRVEYLELAAQSRELAATVETEAAPSIGDQTAIPNAPPGPEAAPQAG